MIIADRTQFELAFQLEIVLVGIVFHLFVSTPDPYFAEYQRLLDYIYGIRALRHNCF